jgi:hypothetical protein
MTDPYPLHAGFVLTHHSPCPPHAQFPARQLTPPLTPPPLTPPPLSAGIGTAIEFWKVTKAMDVSVSNQFPFLSIKHRVSYSNNPTKEYDRTATCNDQTPPPSTHPPTHHPPSPPPSTS